jgi:cytochrome c-type biogenesis protein CcmF
MEFGRGAAAISRKDGLGPARSVLQLFHRNTRRYGGYVVHMGIVLIFVGLTGAAFNRETKTEIRIGDRVNVGNYSLAVREISTGEDDNHLWQRAGIEVYRDGQPVGALAPQREVYKASRQSIGRIDIRHTLNEDLYVNFAGLNDKKAVIEAYLFPLVNWLWMGAFVLVVGTLITLVRPQSTT